MSPGPGLLVFFLLTVLLLAGVVATGLRARRRLHVPLVVAALGSLGVTIFHAERLGRLYDLDGAGWITPTHLTLAKITVLAFVFPVVTGLTTLRRPGARRWHRLAVVIALTLTVCTSITGTWMILTAERVETGRSQRDVGTSSVEPSVIETSSTWATSGSAPARIT